MVQPRRAVVTGAFSNIGGAVAAELLARGWQVASVTNRAPAPGDDPRVERTPLRFDADHLATALRTADLVVNTYWIRFPYAGLTFDDAVANIGRLIDASRAAGVRRFVQVGVSNASIDSTLGYYRGKAQVDQQLRSSGLSYAIVRPTLVVGPKDVLTNNMAWFLRRFPVVALPRGEGYELQPVTLADAGRIIAGAAETAGDIEVDAAGPERFTFREYLRLLGVALDKRPRFLSLPPAFMIAALRIAGWALRDVVLTREELAGLQQNLLVSRAEPLGRESVRDWLLANGQGFGSSYANDTKYRFRGLP